MGAELANLLDEPIMPVAILILGVAIGSFFQKLIERDRRARRKAYWAGRKHGKGKQRGKVLPFGEKNTKSGSDLSAEQLRCVMEANFKARELLNKSERRLLEVIDRALVEHSPSWRAMGQVSLGEILSSPDKSAYSAVNSKRVDLLIIDENCRPLHAVEFQGSGHHISKNTAARDAVKREALRRAGIGYVEVVRGDTPSEVAGMIKKLVERQST